MRSSLPRPISHCQAQDREFSRTAVGRSYVRPKNQWHINAPPCGRPHNIIDAAVAMSCAVFVGIPTPQLLAGHSISRIAMLLGARRRNVLCFVKRQIRYWPQPGVLDSTPCSFCRPISTACWRPSQRSKGRRHVQRTLGSKDIADDGCFAGPRCRAVPNIAQ